MFILKSMYALMIWSRHKDEEGFGKMGVAMFSRFQIFGLHDGGPIFQREVSMS